jgi:hypothetical protein
MIARSIDEWLDFRYLHDDSTLILTILAATSVTIKLSNLMYSSVVFTIVLILLWKSSHQRARDYYRIFATATVMILVWSLRGFILSGAPLYPSTFGYTPMEWAVPKEAVVDEANWIFSWARQPNSHWSEVLGNWNWFKPWILANSKDLQNLLYQIALSALALVIIIIIGISKNKHLKYLEFTILFPLVFSLFYWFFTAPDIRFANAVFYLLPTSLVILLLSYMHTFVSKKVFLILLSLAFIFSNYNYAKYSINHRELIKEISLSGFQAIKTISLNIKQTSSGLSVYVPVEGDQCWDSPLPCTPYFNPSLSLREPSNPGSGFIVTDYEDLHYQ